MLYHTYQLWCTNYVTGLKLNITQVKKLKSINAHKFYEWATPYYGCE
jgi:hypothetical protein